MPIDPAMPKRRIARAAAAAPALGERGGRQAAVDVEQGHGRGQAHPQRAAVEGDLAASRPPRAARTSRPARTGPGRAAGGVTRRSAPPGSARRARGRSVGAEPWRLGPAGLRDRLAHDLGAERRRPRSGLRQRLDQWLRCRRRARRCPAMLVEPAPSTTAPARSPGSSIAASTIAPSSTRIARSSPIPSS